jgi:hypothetical protein
MKVESFLSIPNDLWVWFDDSDEYNMQKAE